MLSACRQHPCMVSRLVELPWLVMKVLDVSRLVVLQEEPKTRQPWMMEPLVGMYSCSLLGVSRLEVRCSQGVSQLVVQRKKASL